jgi:RNA polymerase-binding transcription factor DksA
METSMTSGSNEQPPGPARPDLILMALFQSRLRERSIYLGELIQSKRRRLRPPPASDDIGLDEGDSTLEHIRLAEQALAAVHQAEERIGRGRYGLCDDCHAPIGWDELLESPEQTVCRGCSQFGELAGSLLRS